MWHKMSGKNNSIFKNSKKGVSVCEVLRPIQNLARLLDEKVPTLEKKLNNGTRLPITEHNFPYGGWNKLQQIKKDVEKLTVECEAELTKTKQRVCIMSELNDSASKCLKMADAHVSFTEAEFAWKGYVKPKTDSVPSRASAQDHDNVFQTNETRTKNAEDEDKIHVNKAGQLKDSSVDLPKMGGDNSVPDSPCVPLLSIPAEVCCTPVPPDFCNKSCNEKVESSLLSSPDIKGLDKIKTKRKVENSFFPTLCTPETPVLSPTILNKYSKETAEKHDNVVQPQAVSHDVDDEDDDDDKLVMHSRRSFLASCNENEYYAENNESTVNLLKSRMPPQKHDNEIRTPVTPVTPDLANCGLMKAIVRGRDHVYFNKAPGSCEAQGSEDIPESPVTPEFLQKARESHQLSKQPCIDLTVYLRLPSAIRRLVSLEQATFALQNLRHYAKQKTLRTLTYSEIERVTGLGGKTNCCILLLTSLELIHKIPGTGEYSLTSLR